MAQNLPNAEVSSQGSGAGYSLACADTAMFAGGVEYPKNSIQNPGDGNNASSTEDSRFALMDTSSSTATFTLSTADNNEGRVITVVDIGGNATNNAITVNTEGSANVDGGSSISVGSNHGQVTVMSDGTNWWSVG